MEVLEQGSKGAEVEQLQFMLKEIMSCEITVDGDYGKETEYYVKIFQQGEKLEVDGIAGQKTQTKLNEVYSELFPKQETKSLRERLECHLILIEGQKAQGHKLARPLTDKLDLNIKKGSMDTYHQIVAHLDVLNRYRYQKRDNKTFCNIYAYDYCYPTHAYLPRVWWTKEAFERILNGETLIPTYPVRGVTKGNIEEMNANSLFEWLCNEGKEYFGWEGSGHSVDFQNLVNNGAVGLICAKNNVVGCSGHIAPVLSETEKRKMHKGVPLQCQAGGTNKEYFNKNWYSGKRWFGDDWGFFVCRQPK